MKNNFIFDTDSILQFLKILRQSDRYIEMIYLNGACYKLHLLLKNYIDCTPYINTDKNHVVTNYKGKFFDITGEVKGDYILMDKEDVKIANTWSFHQTKMIELKECHVCGEPLLI